MPLEVVLLSPEAIGLEDQREFAELMNPPLVAREIRNGGAVVFSEMDDTPVLTLARAKRVETQTDLIRLLGEEAAIPEDTAFCYEGVLPFDYERGLTVLFAFGEALGGTAIVRGITL